MPLVAFRDSDPLSIAAMMAGVTDPVVSDAAEQLHRDALVLDSHNDSIVLHIRLGNRSFSDRPGPADAAASSRSTHQGTIRYLRGPYPRGETPEPQVTFAKMRAGGLDAAFFSVDVTRARHNHVAYAMDGHGFFTADVAAHP